MNQCPTHGGGHAGLDCVYCLENPEVVKMRDAIEAQFAVEEKQAKKEGREPRDKAQIRTHLYGDR